MIAKHPQAKHIQCLILDIDGVMTNGHLYFSDSGEEMKSFYVQDGLGIKLLQQIGINIAIITARNSPLVAHRANNLGIQHLYQGQKNKRQAFEDLLSQLNIQADQCAYMGDDIIDLPVLTRVGLAVAPANAHPAVLPYVDHQTQAAGGQGAIRELADQLLIAQDQYQSCVDQFLQL